jgi:hypothetical protein
MREALCCASNPIIIQRLRDGEDSWPKRGLPMSRMIKHKSVLAKMKRVQERSSTS